MSIKVMSWVLEHGPQTASARLLMVALADFCDDSGMCFPSMAKIAAKACVTERGAQKIISRLEAEGWVSVSRGGGRHGCNRYIINRLNPEPETPNHVLPEPRSPRTRVQKPRTTVQETPNSGSPEPSLTIIETSPIEIVRKRTPARTTIPHDATISQAMLEVARKRGVTDDEAEAQFTRFRDRAIAKGERYADWNAAWRNWLTSPYFAPITGRRSTGGRSDAERLDDHLDALKARLAVQRLE